jgi:hypothetical protein
VWFITFPETRHQTFQAPNSSPEMSTEILDLKKKEKRKEMPGHTNNNFEICYALASYVNSKYCPAMETGSIENGRDSLSKCVVFVLIKNPI